MENHLVQESLTIKVHGEMCSELFELVVRISKIIPEIEAVRPRASGIETLSLLVHAISEANSLFQQWSEASSLYLAFTGDRIMSKCNKTKNLLEHCLDRIQNMVPPSLATEISGIIIALRRAAFGLDPTEEMAGKELQEMLRKYGCKIDEGENFAVSSICIVCSWLRISSAKDLAIERRSIKKQLSKVGGSKKKVLNLFLALLNNYPNLCEDGSK